MIGSKSHTVAAIGEVQLGVEYARQLGYGATGFVQCLWEGQVWSNVNWNPLLDAPEDLGLMGLVLNVGIAQ